MGTHKIIIIFHILMFISMSLHKLRILKSLSESIKASFTAKRNT